MSALRKDRVAELLEGVNRRRRILVSPEGVPLDIQVAGLGERLVAFCIDMAIIMGVILTASLVLNILYFRHTTISVGMTLITFITFLTRVLYFIHFELAWQGRTPGKKTTGLRVVTRAGGELTPSSVIARNLTREVEVFYPLHLLSYLDGSGWQQVLVLAWLAVLVGLPLFNKERLRAGDLIAGTMVIAMPKRVLLADLSDRREIAPAGQRAVKSAFVFTPAQLEVYGAFELQVLEEFLRRPPTEQTDILLQEVCRKICAKIGWKDPLPATEVRRFLTDFYAAERAVLERSKLFGKLREDKHHGPANKPE